MSESKFTPGPWVRRGSAIVALAGQGKVADVKVDDREGVANANLITAAPEMLEALQAARKLWGDYLPAGNSNAMKAMRLVDAAIAKTTASPMGKE
ncbi:hypothetical protein M2401_000844 [Pseudomonas sp. JUb42]|uniref:hypothetical protein n=1 Tax=Pseudomonas sp. JUb42 TaxID=2940611 RepID=UPI00216A8B3D|nr:hypothetical protein [Pseudomonas sp. JUb42]MCS3467123.1 hypothetical protein [Pseudomonas sp. JUb42]